MRYGGKQTFQEGGLETQLQTGRISEEMSMTWRNDSAKGSNNITLMHNNLL